jgi:hypothetical protein
MLTTFQLRKAQLIAEHEAFGNLDQTEDQEQFEKEQQQRADHCAVRQAAAAALAEELGKLLNFCQSALTLEGRNA